MCVACIPVWLNCCCCSSHLHSNGFNHKDRREDFTDVKSKLCSGPNTYPCWEGARWRAWARVEGNKKSCLSHGIKGKTGKGHISYRTNWTFQVRLVGALQLPWQRMYFFFNVSFCFSPPGHHQTHCQEWSVLKTNIWNSRFTYTPLARRSIIQIDPKSQNPQGNKKNLLIKIKAVKHCLCLFYLVFQFRSAQFNVLNEMPSELTPSHNRNI